MSKGNSKEAYNAIKELTKVEQPNTTAIEDTDGKLLTESAAVLGRWTQYCQDLYNHELKVDEEIIKEKMVYYTYLKKLVQRELFPFRKLKILYQQ